MSKTLPLEIVFFETVFLDNLLMTVVTIVTIVTIKMESIPSDASPYLEVTIYINIYIYI